MTEKSKTASENNQKLTEQKSHVGNNYGPEREEIEVLMTIRCFVCCRFKKRNTLMNFKDPK